MKDVSTFTACDNVVDENVVVSLVVYLVQKIFTIPEYTVGALVSLFILFCSCCSDFVSYPSRVLFYFI